MISFIHQCLYREAQFEFTIICVIYSEFLRVRAGMGLQIQENFSVCLCELFHACVPVHSCITNKFIGSPKKVQIKFNLVREKIKLIQSVGTET